MSHNDIKLKSIFMKQILLQDTKGFKNNDDLRTRLDYVTI